jgi:hypothetical protein
MLEAEWKEVLWGSMSTGAKEDESSTGHNWAAGFHHVTACSFLAGVLKFTNHLFLQFSNFLSGRSEPQILNQWIWGHDCTDISKIMHSRETEYNI